MSLFTVPGGGGFIGRHLSAYLRAQGHEVHTPERDAANLRGRDLGHVVYCIGMTGNFRDYPQRAVDAHVNRLYDLMSGAAFDSWLYLSSTRIYGGLPAGQVAREGDVLPVTPSADSLYDLTKMLGEAICLGHADPSVRVARLSNVYGAGQGTSTFLGAVLREAATAGAVTIGEDQRSAKDYLSIEDTVFYLKEIALKGSERLYNVASGRSVSHGDIAAVLAGMGKTVDFAQGGAHRVFPPVDVSRLVGEFGAARHDLLRDLPEIMSVLSTQNGT